MQMHRLVLDQQALCRPQLKSLLAANASLHGNMPRGIESWSPSMYLITTTGAVPGELKTTAQRAAQQHWSTDCTTT